jgi:uncharacterized delta-60 repeat protein
MKTLSTLLFSLFLSFSSFAQQGLLDTSFAGTGIALGPFTSAINQGTGMVQQPDGKILVTGFQDDSSDINLFIVRYNTDGSFDASFGNNGIVTDSVTALADFGRSIALRSDGKIFVAGEFDSNNSFDIFVKCFDSTGTADPTFGTNSVTSIDIDNFSEDQVTSMAIQSDGKILVAGWAFDFGGFDLFVTRFNSDGTVDSTFGTNGIVLMDILNSAEFITGIALQSNGKIVIVGTMLVNTTSAAAPFLLRVNSDGTSDNSFATNGGLLPVLNGSDNDARSVAIQPDGKIVFGGAMFNGIAYDAYVARIDSNGATDTSFNSVGYVFTDINNGNDDNVQAVMLQADGSIVAVGHTGSADYDILLLRYLSNGTIDSTFGLNGIATSPIGNEDDQPLVALLQPDNKIVVTGYYEDSGLENLFTARFNNGIIIPGIEKLKTTNEIIIYPQPAVNEIHILNGDQYTQATIFSSDGRIAAYTQTTGNVIDVHNLPGGMYVLQCIDHKGKVLHRKIIIQ